MEIREAIGIVETIREHIERPTEEISAGLAITALTGAIEALEKQLPKKPVLKRNAYGSISACPICGASDYGKYCRQCGQRINWEEEENERIREDFRSVRKKSKFQKNASKT